MYNNTLDVCQATTPLEAKNEHLSIGRNSLASTTTIMSDPSTCTCCQKSKSRYPNYQLDDIYKPKDIMVDLKEEVL